MFLLLYSILIKYLIFLWNLLFYEEEENNNLEPQPRYYNKVSKPTSLPDLLEEESEKENLPLPKLNQPILVINSIQFFLLNPN